MTAGALAANSVSHNDATTRPGRTSVDERPLELGRPVSREHSWIPAMTVDRIRAVVAAHLDGRRDLNAEVERLAAELAKAAHDAEYRPERMLIAIRSLWREFTLSQHDRLQLASLYDRLVRRTIDRYYED